ncbi:MAG: hypothetical protein ACREMY_26280, partial [bacterium]
PLGVLRRRPRVEPRPRHVAHTTQPAPNWLGQVTVQTANIRAPNGGMRRTALRTDAAGGSLVEVTAPPPTE